MHRGTCFASICLFSYRRGLEETLQGNSCFHPLGSNDAKLFSVAPCRGVPDLVHSSWTRLSKVESFHHENPIPTEENWGLIRPYEEWYLRKALWLNPYFLVGVFLGVSLDFHDGMTSGGLGVYEGCVVTTTICSFSVGDFLSIGVLFLGGGSP